MENIPNPLEMRTQIDRPKITMEPGIYPAVMTDIAIEDVRMWQSEEYEKKIAFIFELLYREQPLKLKYWVRPKVTQETINSAGVKNGMDSNLIKLLRAIAPDAIQPVYLCDKEKLWERIIKLLNKTYNLAVMPNTNGWNKVTAVYAYATPPVAAVDDDIPF